MAYDPVRVPPEVYAQLRALARRIHRDCSGRDSLRPTEMLHEAWLKVGGEDRAYADRAHFVAVAARAMRQVLIDHARERGAQKRGGDPVRTTLTGLSSMQADPVDALDLEAALQELEASAPRDAEVVVLRLIGGLSVAEVAELLGVSPSTVERSWRRGRAWLGARLEVSDG